VHLVHLEVEQRAFLHQLRPVQASSHASSDRVHLVHLEVEQRAFLHQLRPVQALLLVADPLAQEAVEAVEAVKWVEERRI